MVRGSQELIFLSSLSLPLFFFFIHPLLCVSGLGFRQKLCSSVGDVLDMLASGSNMRRVGPTAFVQFLHQMGRCIRFYILILKEE